MAKEKLVVISESDFTNNCPECFNQELKITFYQKHIESKLYHKVTSEVDHEMQCKTCGSTIYPIKWTENIERVFEYYRKMVTPEPSSMQFTPLFYLLFGLLALLIGAVIYLYSQGII